MDSSEADHDKTGELDGLPVHVIDVKDDWPSLRVGRTVPLGRLEWIWTLRGASVKDSSTSARAVFNVTSSPQLSETTSYAPHEWFRKSYLYVLIVTLDELEVFRESSGWPRVRNFVDGCRERHLEYLVICVADDNAVKTYRRLIDKLRAEVNPTTRGRERVVTVPTATSNDELRPISHLHHSPSHQDLLVRLRECIHDEVEARVQEYEAECGRVFANKTAPSWSFLSYFSLKEGMSFVFVQIGRRDLALKCYDELSNILTEPADMGITSFCASIGSDAAVGVVDPEAKHFRTILLSGTITELDFRTYLFARQVSLLLADRKYSEVAERGLKFIATVARRIAEEASTNPGTTSPLLRDAWVFRAARSLADALAPAIPSSAVSAPSLSKQLGTARERHTARLIAGFHVHALKAFSGLAQLCLPGTLVPLSNEVNITDGSVPPQLTESVNALSNDELKTALQDSIKAVELYSEMANAAASLYEMGGRQRGAAALDGDAGVVRLRNNSYSEAEELLSAQCSRFSDDQGWDQLHRRRRVELAFTEKMLDRVQEYLVSCLTMLLMTRTGRRVGMADSALENDAELSKNAEYWALEAAKATSRLPRVMKYKAEKLLTVSLRPRSTPWYEGESGGATVVVESDIPTDLKIDNISVEFKCIPAVDRSDSKLAASALRRPDVLDIGTPNEDLLSVSPQCSGVSMTFQNGSQGGYSEPLVLSRDKPFYVRPGLTEIRVSCDEVPRAGRYVVSMVCLVVGRLKLVQGGRKYPIVPTVTTRGQSSPRPSSTAMEASASNADHGSSKSGLPCFFAMTRIPTGVVRIDRPDVLYLMPASVQHVHLVITAGRNGLVRGSRISLALSAGSLCGPTAAPSVNTLTFVRFVNTALTLANSEAKDREPTDLLAVHLESDSDHTKAEATLACDVPPGENLVTRVAICVDASCNIHCDNGVDRSVKGRSCYLRVDVACSELLSSRKRPFICETESKLEFTSPFSLSARTELSLGGDDIPILHSPGHNIDFEPFHAFGGLLVCSLRCRAGPGRFLTLKRAALVPPSWLELRNDISLPHESLLPCRLANNSLFSLAFELNVRSTPNSSSTPVGIALSHGSDRTLSRLTDSLDVDRSDTCKPEESAENDSFHRTERGSDDSSVLLSRDGGSRDSRCAFRQTTDFEDVPGEEEYGDIVRDLDMETHTLPVDAVVDETLSPSTAAMALEQIEVNDTAADGCTVVVDDASSTSHVMRRRRSSCNSDSDSRLRRRTENAENGAIDFPTQQRFSIDSMSPCAKMPVGGLIARLILEYEIDGIEQASMAEQQIIMSAFCPPHQRYRIERVCETTVVVGQPVSLRFQVSVIPSAFVMREDSSYAEKVHYEIDAGRTEWLVVGKRRGQLVVSGAEGDLGRAVIIPLKSGRLFVPHIKLYDRDGSAQISTRFENLNKGYQVTVLPESFVSSICSSAPISSGARVNWGTSAAVAEASELHAIGRPVAVVPADAFFG
jgi:Trafficking protein particle complex subunit 10, TRAPPC10